ncbi:hypothetical protein KIN20_006083 [Parelaphostrongylus tenuis]|uniref:Uncharacterized protein n=1 Tax=Parelaphostrongylus tenuis TaxID=148309 RepID=A0AAD5M475_PARTN|nr:hypothetical protein KIN20_006083 [Parelaphostrongylus tenuis]
MASDRNEMERINELRRRDEEMRRIAAKRREEERRREQEQRQREEERRREFARREEQRIREEQRMHGKQELNKIYPKSREMAKETTVDSGAVDSAGTDDDVPTPNLDDWDYKSDEDDTTRDYHHGDKQIGDGDDDIYGHATTIGSTGTSTERMETQTLSGITKAIEIAADKTAMIHGIDMQGTTVGPGEDDYWDHSVKNDYEDMNVPERASSNQQSDAAPAPMRDGVHQFAAEEGEEGWMMMKRVDEESSAATFISISTTAYPTL